MYIELVFFHNIVSAGDLVPKRWVGVGGLFSKVVATFNNVGGSFDLIMATTE